MLHAQAHDAPPTSAELEVTLSDPRKRSESTMSALESSNMVTEGVVRERTFSGTIWDAPQEAHENGNGTVGNGLGTTNNEVKVRNSELVGSTTL